MSKWSAAKVYNRLIDKNLLIIDKHINASENRQNYAIIGGITE
jgi:hypothetical protein